MISNEQLRNRAYSSDAIAFNQQMPGRSKHSWFNPEDVPPGIQVNEDGSVICRFYAPDAQTVAVGPIQEEAVPMQKGEGGVWTATLRFPFPGIKVIVWLVNGVEVLNPYAPIGYGYGHPMNFVDIPCPEQDYLMLKDVPHGSVIREYFPSKVTGAWESCLVYVPPMYFSEPERRFPVIYLQHGALQNENGWIYEAKTNFIADNLLAEGRMEPAIIVMNNGMVQMPTEDGQWVYDFESFQDLLIEDCIPFIDKKYRTFTDAWNRAYAGLSLGSLQGSKIFMERRDLFASAGLFTGYKRPPFYNGKQPEDYLQALNDPEDINRTARLFYIAVGQNEVSYDKVYQESETLTALGIRHVFHSFPGDHEWHVWRACLHDFLQLVFKD